MTSSHHWERLLVRSSTPTDSIGIGSESQTLAEKKKVKVSLQNSTPRIIQNFRIGPWPNYPGRATRNGSMGQGPGPVSIIQLSHQLPGPLPPNDAVWRPPSQPLTASYRATNRPSTVKVQIDEQRRLLPFLPSPSTVAELREAPIRTSLSFEQ